MIGEYSSCALIEGEKGDITCTPYFQDKGQELSIKEGGTIENGK